MVLIWMCLRRMVLMFTCDRVEINKESFQRNKKLVESEEKVKPPFRINQWNFFHAKDK